MYEETQDMYINWLYHIPGIGKKKMSCLLKGEKSIKEVYEAGEKELKEYICEIYKRSAIHEKIALSDAAKIREVQSFFSPEKLYEELKKKQIEFLFCESGRYPARLKDIPDFPIVLYRKGKKTDNKLCKPTSPIPTVAVVGTRNCSEYGRYIAGTIGKLCGEMGIAVVSGMACGIDGIAQWHALQNGSDVTAVLGCGVDICYPWENRELYKNLLEKGEIYSEYIPGTEPRSQNFPPRNRIISGLADAVIVVEAKEKSGTLITVDMALEQGKDVYVIPGRITDSMSVGCNRLVVQGAEMIVDIKKTLLEICEKKGLHNTNRGIINSNNDSPYRMGNNTNYENANMDGITKSLLKVLDFTPQNVQQLYDKLSQMGNSPDIRVLHQKLICLEMEGVIAESGGEYHKKTGY